MTDSPISRVTFPDIPESSFSELVKKRHIDNDTAFENEYDTITEEVKRDNYQSTQSKEKDNIPKNRYYSNAACEFISKLKNNVINITHF